MESSFGTEVPVGPCETGASGLFEVVEGAEALKKTLLRLTNEIIVVIGEQTE